MSKTRAKPIPLTREQQRLIEDFYLNEDGEKQIKSCIGKTLHRWLSDEEMEEYKSVAHEGLVKAARNYEMGKGAKFSTFAHLNMSSFIKSFCTYNSRQCRSPEQEALSLQDIISYTDDSTFEEIIGDDEISADNQVESEDLVEQVLDKMNKFERKVTRLFMCGFTIADVARYLHCSEQSVRNVRDVTYKKSDIIKVVNMIVIKNR